MSSILEENFSSSESPVSVIENVTGQAGDRFGDAVAARGKRLIFGVPLDDDESAPAGRQDDEGRIDPYLFERISRFNFE